MSAAAPIVQKVTLLTPEKSKNLEIILQKLKLSYPTIANAVITGDDKVLTLANLESFNIIAPTQ